MKLRICLLIASVLLALHFLETTSRSEDNGSTNRTTNIEEETTNEPPVPGQNYTNSVGMELVKTAGGFWAGKYEVTQKQFLKIMGSNPSAFAGETRPVDSINWNEAVEFCKKMTAEDLKKKVMPAGYHYSLPTEDEWQSLVGDADLGNAVCSLNGGIRGETSMVGSTAPNSYGLYDVRGNVMEFCLTDESQSYRILKGGSWQDRVEVNLRPEFRWYCRPDERLNAFGFRCLLKAD